MQSHAYTEFRQFLELGCMGSPAEAYPAILVVLSTIPPSVSIAESNFITRAECRHADSRDSPDTS